MSAVRDKLEEAHQLLVDGVAALVSGEQWQAMLEASARFHSYSPNNVMLLMLQGAEGRVAGYRTWQHVPAEDGGTCQVAKGAKALRILAPMVGRSRAAEEGDEPGARRLFGFRVVSVFDQTQLVSPPAIEEVAPTLLEGHGPVGVYDALAAQVEAAGFRIEPEAALAPANGRTNFATRVVSIAEGLSPAQRCKTMAHELAHALQHDPAVVAPTQSRAEKEVEAESVAWLVTRHAGLAADDYSFPYVAGWSGGDVDRVRAVFERVVPTARSIIAGVDAALVRDLAPEAARGIAAEVASPPGPTPDMGPAPEPAVAHARSLVERPRPTPKIEPPGLGLS